MRYKLLSLSNLLILLTVIAGIWITSELITPLLHYHLKQPAFLTKFDFFYTYSEYPGGIADYLSEFIGQFFISNLFGTILIIAIASIQGFIAIAIIKPFVNHLKFNYSIFTLVLIFGILVLSNYYYPYYASIRLLFAFIFVWLFSIVNNKNSNYSLIVWIALATLLFYIADGFALFVFALSSTFIILLSNKKPIRNFYIPVFLIFAGILPYLAYRFIFPEGIGNLYKIILIKPPAMLQYEPENSIYIYYFLLPAFLLLIILFRMVNNLIPISNKNGIQKSAKNSPFDRTIYILALQVIACSAIGYFVYKKSYNPDNKNLLYIEYYAEHEDWHSVLKMAEKINRYDYRINFQVCRAYEHFGKLADKLFDYPPLLGSQGLFIDITSARSESMPTSDLFFDLGFMDESQHWAFEAQTLMPNSPRILKRLVMINLVNQKYNLANKFLNILDENMLYHDWVQNYKRYITDTAIVETDRLIMEKRLFSPKKTTINTRNIDKLKLLFETNHNNRMAYDYLLSYLILDTQDSEFVNYLQYYNYFNLKTLPKSWEETFILHIAKNGTIPKNIPFDLITKDCSQRFTDFTNKITLHKNNIQAAKSTVLNDYGKTYWYYLLYISPTVAKNIENKTSMK